MIQYLPLLSYLFVMAVTPGPNNIMLAVSGVNFGFRRSLPHMLGICTGNALQVILCGTLFSLVGKWLEQARPWLAGAGCIYLLWLSWKIARAGSHSGGQALRPLSFLEGVFFQAVNPKAWIMVVNTVLLFLPQGAGWQGVVVLAGLGIAVGFPSITLWSGGGETLAAFLKKPAALRGFNVTMGLLLAATALWLLVDEWSSTVLLK